MIKLIEMEFGQNRTILTANLLDFPLREVAISISGGFMSVSDLEKISQEIIKILDFVQNNPDPWNNSYE